ncbi:MAG: T9SS type A sorting domain-containing protein [Bacteroidia bacterium]|nr:T9SS type A sorting domain-containing protein [Bacteroidia bacterium]
MKKRILTLVSISVILLSGTAFIVKKSSGGIVGRTGSPGESGCDACHSGGAGITTVSITANPAFVANKFIPGQTYTVSITVSNASFSNFGFGCEILTPSNTNAGNMTTALSGVTFANSGARKNAIHNAIKGGTGTAVFQFVWVAPTSGTATVYAAGNAVNGTGGTGGDRPGLTNLVLTADLSSGITEAQSTSFSGITIFPNPIADQFKVNYNLLEDGEVKAAIYDLQGKFVSDLFSENQSAGFHSQYVDLPENCAGGVYFLKLSQPGKKELQRIIIVQ